MEQSDIEFALDETVRDGQAAVKSIRFFRAREHKYLANLLSRMKEDVLNQRRLATATLPEHKKNLFVNLDAIHIEFVQSRWNPSRCIIFAHLFIETSI